jgi:hypothetical protein
VFIYDIEANTWHKPDTKSLHELDIYSCHIYNNQLLLNIDDDAIYQYDIETDQLTKLFDIEQLHDTQINNNILYGYNKSILHSYHLITHEHNTMTLCDSEDMIRHWDMNIRLVFTEKYVNPYGQIYKENRDDEAPTRNRKITFI